LFQGGDGLLPQEMCFRARRGRPDPGWRQCR
jgi:hypothetical protein